MAATAVAEMPWPAPDTDVLETFFTTPQPAAILMRASSRHHSRRGRGSSSSSSSSSSSTDYSSSSTATNTEVGSEHDADLPAVLRETLSWTTVGLLLGDVAVQLPSDIEKSERAQQQPGTGEGEPKLTRFPFHYHNTILEGGGYRQQ